MDNPTISTARIRDDRLHTLYFFKIKLSRNEADVEQSDLSVMCTDGERCWQAKGVRRVSPSCWAYTT